MLIIPVFVPHEGCPHDCCFCDQKKISGKVSTPTETEIINEIEKYSDIKGNYDSVQIAFFGGSFTAIDKNKQLFYLGIAKKYIDKGMVDSIRISTRPDCIDEEVLDRLELFHVRTIELGAQSMDDDVLNASGRGHTSCDTVKASKLIKSRGFELGLQTMTGLPGSSYESDIRTSEEIIKLQPSLVRIYPTIVIKGTHLHEMYEDHIYEPPELSKTVELCAELMMKYERVGINVIRMGLHSTVGVSVNGDVVAGPYHPAFGQLVKSKIAYNKLIEIGIVDGDTFTAYVPEKELSDYIGQKRSNVELLKKHYGCKNVNIKPIKMS